MAILGINAQEVTRLLSLQATVGGIFNGDDVYIIDNGMYQYVAVSNDLQRIVGDAQIPVYFDPDSGEFVAEGYVSPGPPVTLPDVGWAEYVDTTYTDGSPFSVTNDTDTAIPNNAGSSTTAEQPSGITLYDSATGKIQGNDGDALIITIEYKIERVALVSTWDQEIWLDVNGTAIHRKYSRMNGAAAQVRHMTETFLANVDSSWATNGAIPYIRTGIDTEVYDIRFRVSRIYEA